MSTDHSDRGDNFLRRWSRVKTEARDEAASHAAAPAAAPASVPAKADADTAPPELPPVDELTLESDFSGFFHPKVDEDLRRAALRKLFSDPHFNVMDGLDVYIDDYSKTEPIPAAMLASLKQAQRILEWAAETKEEAEARRAAPELIAPEVAVEPAALPEPEDEAASPSQIDLETVPRKT